MSPMPAMRRPFLAPKSVGRPRRSTTASHAPRSPATTGIDGGADLPANAPRYVQTREMAAPWTCPVRASIPAWMNSPLTLSMLGYSKKNIPVDSV